MEKKMYEKKASTKFTILYTNDMINTMDEEKIYFKVQRTCQKRNCQFAVWK